MAMSRSFGATSFTTRPPMSIVPSEISSRPAIIRRAVDLPQPDGPTSTMNSWSRMSRFKPSMTETSPYRLATSLKTTSAMRGPPRSAPGRQDRGAPGRKGDRDGALRKRDGKGAEEVLRRRAAPLDGGGEGDGRGRLAAVDGHRDGVLRVRVEAEEDVAVAGRDEPHVRAAPEGGMRLPDRDELHVVGPQRLVPRKPLAGED